VSAHPGKKGAGQPELVAGTSIKGGGKKEDATSKLEQQAGTNGKPGWG